MIDGAVLLVLTSKPYRYSARSWEMRQAKGVVPHDNLGSNISFRVKGQRQRVAPRENEDVNHIWILIVTVSARGYLVPIDWKQFKQKIDGMQRYRL